MTSNDLAELGVIGDASTSFAKSSFASSVSDIVKDPEHSIMEFLIPRPACCVLHAAFSNLLLTCTRYASSTLLPVLPVVTLINVMGKIDDKKSIVTQSFWYINCCSVLRKSNKIVTEMSSVQMYQEATHFVILGTRTRRMARFWSSSYYGRNDVTAKISGIRNGISNSSEFRQ
jgi:hypothetical protein